MKNKLVTILCLALCYQANTQSPGPSRNLVKSKWMKDDAYNMKWYMLRDTAKIEMADIKVTITWNKNDQKLYVVQQIQMKQMPNPWIDSTVGAINTLAPLYHSSYNTQRNMSLKYDRDSIYGFYKDAGGKVSSFSEKASNYSFFDSNLYPFVLNWLPLKNGYTRTFSIYNYDGQRHGVFSAHIRSCESTKVISNQGSEIDCWKLVVEDEISPGSKTVYYISKKGRKIRKMEMEAGPRKMLMIRVE